MRLQDKVAIITGAASGIGREAALIFAREGARVVVADMNDEAGNRTVGDIAAAGGEAVFISTNVARAASVEVLVRQTEEQFGRLDVIFNNAGIFPDADGSVLDTTEDVWDQVMSVNLKGVFLGCKYAIPAMQRAGGGSIVNVASFVALMGAACTNFAPPATHAPAASPSASAAATTAPQLNWAEALSFSGDVKGTMYQVVVGDQGTRSECTGRNSRYGGAWASTLYGTVGKEVYGVLVTVRPYAGPGSYRVPVLSVQVSRPDGSGVWQTSGGDTATFVVGSDEESGTLQATLTDLNSNTTKLRLSGRWSCVT